MNIQPPPRLVLNIQSIHPVQSKQSEKSEKSEQAERLTGPEICKPVPLQLRILPNTNKNWGSRSENNEGSLDHNNNHTELDNFDDSFDPLIMGGFSDWASGSHVMTNSDRSILPHLESYHYPDDIKNQADLIYNKMVYRVRRGKIFKKMLFYCVYNAHLELGRNVNPFQLGAQFGLSSGEVQKCDSIFSPLQTGYKPPYTPTSPLRYLTEYCKDMGLADETIHEIVSASVVILRKDPSLNQESPQTVAAGLLRYFSLTNGITSDDPQMIFKVTGRSNVTIDGIYRRIATIDNS